MENSYGIGTRNRYELFLSEEDPLEILKAQEQEKEAKKKTKLNEKENRGKNELPGKPTQPARKGIKDSINIKTSDYMKVKEETRAVTSSKPDANKTKVVRPANDRFTKAAGESREERNNRRNREERPAQPAEYGNRDAPRMESGGGGGGGGGVSGGDFPRGRGGRGTNTRGMGRGRGRGRGVFDMRGKREFDRQSGSDKSGVKPMDKREGGGAHNWGTLRDEIDDQMNTTHAPEGQAEWSPEKVESETVPEQQEQKEVGGANENDNQSPVEEGPQELTLDEWKALRGNRQKPTFNIRKAGEGEDLTQWKKMYALKKKEGEEEDEEEEEYDAAEYPQRVGRQKHLLDLIDIHFADSRRGTRGRGRGGMRGTGRPGTGRGGPGRMGGGGAPPRGGAGPPGSGVRGPVGSGNDAPPSNVAASSNGAPGGTDSPGRAPAPGDGPPRNNAISSRVRQSAPKVDDENDFPSLG